jgi:general secretion pathway protein D
MLPKAFGSQSGTVSAALAVAMMLGAAGCRTIEDGPVLNEWRPEPLVRASDNGKPAGPRAQGLPLLSRIDDPAATRSVVYGGTGQLISSAARHKSMPGPSNEDGVTLNLVNTSIAESARTILGDILGLNYSVNPNLAGKITIQTSTPVSKSDLVELFQNALRSSGATIIRNGGLYQVESADQFSRSVPELTVGSAGSPGGVVGNSARVVQLKYVAASEMHRILEPMTPKGAIRADDARNTLTLTGTGSDIAAMLDAISVFDADVMRGMSVAVVPVVASQPDAMIADLRAIFGSDKEGPMSGMVRFIPNQKTKSILVVSPQQTYLTRAERWIRNLDAKAQGPDKQLFTYNVRNRPAGELVEIIESMFSSSSRNGSQGGRNVAPRYQQAAVQSAPAGASRSGSSSASLGSPSGTSGSPAGAGTPFGGGDQGTQSDAAASNTLLGTGRSGDEDRVRVSVDDSNNTLLILASRHDYQRVLRIIQNLDVVPNQVLIEAIIAEVTLTDDLKFGLRWHLDGKKAGYSFTGGSSFGSLFPGFSYALAAVNAQLTLNALNTITKVNVISSPSLTVLDKHTATLQIGDQVPVVTQSAVGVVATNAPIVNSVSYRDTGVILSITPRIHESGRVFLKIEQEVSSVASTTTSSIDSPTIKQRRVKTTVQVNDGEALALGGLIQDQITDTRNQIPVLGDIPLIGNAFKEKGGTVGKTELILLITPRVVRNLNEAREITDEYRSKFDVYMPRQRGTQRSVGRTLLRTLD